MHNNLHSAIDPRLAEWNSIHVADEWNMGRMMRATINKLHTSSNLNECAPILRLVHFEMDSLLSVILRCLKLRQVFFIAPIESCIPFFST